jgi:hypothetical protein
MNLKQTENLNLNLIESTDPVDWSPLNANMETIEAQFATQAANTTAIQQDIGTGGQNARIAYGTFIATGETATLQFDFKPVVVFLGDQDGSGSILISTIVRPFYAGNAAVKYVSWDDYSVSYGNAFNSVGHTIHYWALGASD